MAEKLTPERLKQMTDQILADQNSINDLTLEEMIALRNFADPLGAGNVKKSGEELYANISVTNWAEAYMRKLIMTAMVGYIYRTASEYVPDKEIQEIDKKFRIACKKSPGRVAELTEEHDKKVAALTAQARDVVRQFLDRNFNYNPDFHLRTAHTTNPKDPERRDKLEMIREICEVKLPQAAQIEKQLAPKQELVFKYLKEKLLGLSQTITSALATVKKSIEVIEDKDVLTVEQQSNILRNKYQHLVNLEADVKKLAGPITSAETLETLQIAPPVDVFHQFDRYLTNHYEQLREIVEALYHVKPDIEHSITLHSVSSTAEGARNYRIQHERDFQCEVLEITSGCINILGPFRQNRERIDFYNKDTEILKLMSKQVESDHHLGADFMKKAKSNAKKKNIAEAGPDNPALQSYIQTMNQAKDLGVQPNMSLEDQKRIAELHRIAEEIKDDYETPDDAIRINMFQPKENPDGTITLEKNKMYTQAEDPLHLQENSIYRDKYQPVKPDSGITRKESSVVKDFT